MREINMARRERERERKGLDRHNNMYKEKIIIIE